MIQILIVLLDIGFVLVLIPGLAALGVTGLNVILDTAWLKPTRLALCQGSHRWPAFLLPLSPAASVAFAHYCKLHLAGRWIDDHGVATITSTYVSAVFCAYWLSLPRDPGRHPRGLVAILLVSFFWAAGILLMIAMKTYLL